MIKKIIACILLIPSLCFGNIYSGVKISGIADVPIPQVLSSTVMVNVPEGHFAVRIPGHGTYGFYAAGLHWAWYVDATNNIAFKTSSDNLTWSGQTTVAATVDDDATKAVVYDGTHVFYSRNTSTGGCFDDCGLAFREGTPNSNGTVTWLAVEQTLYGSTQGVEDQAIATDSSGHAWICFGDDAVYAGVCVKNANTDGTWSNASGFPHTVETNGTYQVETIPIQMLNGDMYVMTSLYDTTHTAHKANGYYYSNGGNSWTTETAITPSNVNAGSVTEALYVPLICAYSQSGVVYFLYQTDVNDLRFFMRTGTNTFTPDEVFETKNLQNDLSMPVGMFDTDRSFWAIWHNPNTNSIYLKHRSIINGWGQNFTIPVSLSQDPMNQDATVTSYFSMNSLRQTGLTYLDGVFNVNQTIIQFSGN